MADEITKNPFDYKAVTFQDLLQQINSNPLFQGKPEWLKVLIAGRADVLMSYLDARANDVLFQHAFTVRSVNNFSDSLGYERQMRAAAQGNLRVKLRDDVSLPITIPKAELIFSTSEAINGEPVYFSSNYDVEFIAFEQVIPVVEGRIYSDPIPEITVGSLFEELLIARENILPGTSSIVIGLNNWTEVQSLVDSGAADKHYRLITKDTGVYARAGNGKYGALFPNGMTAMITARYGGGTRGNVPAGKVNQYSGASTAILSVSNDAMMAGGAGPESLDSVKRNAPQRIVTQDRAITPGDFKYLSELYPGVSIVYILPNFAGPGSCQIQVVPNGGGNPSGSLLADLTLYIKNKTLLSGIFVDGVEPKYRPVDIDIEVGLSDGAILEDVYDYVKLLCYLIVHETGKEIREIRLAEGIESAILAMNNYFTLTFDPQDASVQNKIKAIMDEIDPTAWGRDIQEFYFHAAAAKIVGVEYLVVNSPDSVFDVASDEITTMGDLLIAAANSPLKFIEESLVFAATADSTIDSDQPSAGQLIVITLADAEVVPP